MRILPFIVLLLSFPTVYCQEKCAAVIDHRYIEPIDMYGTDGKVIHQMKNDTANEDFLHLDILKQTDGYFFVSIVYPSQKDSITGWIKKAGYIGAYKKNEKFPMDLILYKNTIASDTEKISVTNWTPTLLTIEKYADKWVFVSLKQNGQTVRGWIQANELCANSYTYCN